MADYAVVFARSARKELQNLDPQVARRILKQVGHRADFGYVLARSHWGNGLMPEAIAAVVKITLEAPGIYRMEATCDVENKASARALEKSGFSREGLLRRYMIHPNISPEPRDSLLYALTK